MCLEALLDAGAGIRAVLTHEDDPAENRWFRSVAQLAASHGLPVYTPEDPNHPEVLALVARQRPDYIFSFYYRYLLSQDFLNLAKIGAYNLHGSLLPRYRGRAPVNWVLVNGETETGVTLHRMTVRPDAGPIVDQIAMPILEQDTVATLYPKMAYAAGALMARAWPEMAAGRARETEQDHSRASYYGRRRPEDGRILWAAPAKKIHDLIRAVTEPYPGAFTHFHGRKLLIWSAGYDPSGTSVREPGRILAQDAQSLTVACGSGHLVIKTANWEGHSQVSAGSLPSLGLKTGDFLG